MLTRIEDHERRIAVLEAGQAENTRGLQENARNLADNTRITREGLANTSEILAWFHEYQAGLRTAARIGVGIKWIAAVGAAIATIWASIHWPKL